MGMLTDRVPRATKQNTTWQESDWKVHCTEQPWDAKRFKKRFVLRLTPRVWLQRHRILRMPQKWLQCHQILRRHQKWHSYVTTYCACHEKWHCSITCLSFSLVRFYLFIDFIFVFFSVTFLLWHVSVTFSFYLLLIVSLTFLSVTFFDLFFLRLFLLWLVLLWSFLSVPFSFCCFMFLWLVLWHFLSATCLSVTISVCYFLSVTLPFYVYKYAYIYI